MSAVQDNFTTWYIHGMNSEYFKRLGLPQIPTIFQQPELQPQAPIMYQQHQPMIYQQPQMPVVYQPQAPVVYQQPSQPSQTPLVEDVNTIISRAMDPRIRNLPETDPRRIRLEQAEKDAKKLNTTTTKIEPYPEHSICIKWLKKEVCDGSCKRQHYRYNVFKMKTCKYWSDNNCRFSDPAYCNHAHGYTDPYAQLDYQRESGFKRGRF